MRAIHCVVCNMLSAQDRYSSSFSCSFVRIILIMGAAQSTGAAATGAPGAVPPIQITLNLADVLQGLAANPGGSAPLAGMPAPSFPPEPPAPAPPAGMPAPSNPPEPPAIPAPAEEEAPMPAPAGEQYLRKCQRCGHQSYIREKVCLNEWCEAWNCCEY